MNILNTKNYIYTLSFLFVSFFLFLPAIAIAQVDNLEVIFEEDPLFGEVNFLPGNEVIRTVDVSNNSSEEQDIIVEAINANDDEGFGDKLDLIIKEGETTLYEDTLGDFLRAGEISLSALSSGASTVYSFSVLFNDESGNGLQETSLGFDLCVGFKGGDTNCGDTVAGGEGEVTEGSGTGGGGSSLPGTGGGGGGGIIPPSPLIIKDELVANTDIPGGTALIEWETNYLATSQVIYGLESGGLYSINLTVLPYFGYPLGTVENFSKTILHSVLLTGLIPGKIYRFRVVSRASPPTVGFEHVFKFEEGSVVIPQIDSPLAVSDDDGKGTDGGGGLNTGGSGTTPPLGGGSSSGGATTSPSGETGEVTGSSTSSPLGLEAAAFLSFPDDLTGWLKYIGIILFILFLGWLFWFIFWKRRKKEEEKEKGDNKDNQ